MTKLTPEALATYIKEIKFDVDHEEGCLHQIEAIERHIAALEADRKTALTPEEPNRGKPYDKEGICSNCGRASDDLVWDFCDECGVNCGTCGECCANYDDYCPSCDAGPSNTILARIAALEADNKALHERESALIFDLREKDSQIAKARELLQVTMEYLTLEYSPAPDKAIGERIRAYLGETR